MAVWKRRWKTSKGEEREAWVVEYRDGSGKRHLKTKKRKKDADAYQAEVRVDVGKGMHVAPSKSVTVAAAAENWIKAGQAAGLERATLLQYQQHIDLHIMPLIGRMKLSNLNVPTIRNFEDRLKEQDRSTVMVRKIMVSLSSILADAQERGLVAHNAVRELRRGRKRGKEQRADQRQKGKLQIGIDIPSAEEVKAIMANAKGRWRPLLITAIFTGLRASELRGLTWKDVNLVKHELHVRQRADRYNVIGKPKSHAGERVVPLPTFVVNTLKEWKLACPKGELDLVFPNGAGKVENLGNIIKRGLIPAQGEHPTYTGMHVLRHFYASWLIHQNLPPKVVQERLGHSSITLTYDRYGHLFPRGDDVAKLDKAADALLA